MEEQTQDLQNLFRNITSYLAKLNQTLGIVMVIFPSSIEKYRRHILVTFPSHLKELRSIL